MFYQGLFGMTHRLYLLIEHHSHRKLLLHSVSRFQYNSIINFGFTEYSHQRSILIRADTDKQIFFFPYLDICLILPHAIKKGCDNGLIQFVILHRQQIQNCSCWHP